MRIGHRPLRNEMFAVPAPSGFGLDDGATIVADLDIGQYFRPQIGGTLLVGGTEPAWVTSSIGSTIPTTSAADGRDLGDLDVPTRPADAGVRRAEPTRRAGRPVRRRMTASIYDKSSLGGFLHGVWHER